MFSKVSIVIPTYNEKENILKLIPEIEALRKTINLVLHIIIVDDASPDGTAEVAEEFAKEYRNIVVLRRSGKLGIGSAYKDGFKIALEMGNDIIVEMDADLSHDPKYLSALIEEINRGSDLAIGSRYVPGGSVPGWPLRRRATSKGANFFAKTLLGLQVKDATSGYRALRSAALRKIDLSEIKSDGYLFQVEMLHRFSKLGLNIAETPITFVDRRLGTSKLGLKEIVRFALGVIRLSLGI